MTYQPIADYGVIGDMHTAALVSITGSIDWLCMPRFDAPSVFAAILDDAKGGRFAISPAHEQVQHKQFYWPQTNVLVTRFLCDEGVGEITDFMPVGGEPHQHMLIRRVRVARGTMTFRMQCLPGFNYARDAHTTVITEQGALFHAPDLSISLETPLRVHPHERGVMAEWTLREGETAVFVLRPNAPGAAPQPVLSADDVQDLFTQTVNYWRRWLSKCTYSGRWREMVHRSALALKLLTYEPTGAIVAAPTCSLPESIGGTGNWDYRYAWLRDAAFTVYAFMRIGFTDEACQFMRWVDERCQDCDERNGLQLVYTIDGGRDLPEHELTHLEGYRRSGPVRIGNGAVGQLQLDIYGELMDSVYLFNKYGTPISYETWNNLRTQLDWVCKNWQQADHGIWELRDQKQQFVYSKLMCWVALDRGLRLAEKRSFPAPRERWLQARDALYEDIMQHGWNEELGAFTQAYGGDALDASNLMMPMVFFAAPSDSRMLRTIEAIRRSPAEGGLTSDGLVFRFLQQSSGDAAKQSTFSTCTFWLVEAMTRAGRSDRALLADAQLTFEHMLGYANHLGLYAEQLGPCGEQLGNFPQGLTHLALISAAFNLDRTLNEMEGRGE